MNRWPKHSLFAGVGLIVVVNAIVLGGVAYNRSSEPESVLRLSERELGAPMRGYGNKENSGMALELNWRVLPPDAHDLKKHSWEYAQHNGGSPDWLNQSKMLALGFAKPAVSQSPDGQLHTRQPLQRDVLLVLELNGAAYQTALARVVQFSEAANTQEKKQASDVLKREQDESSRLFVVDAGLEVAALRAQYPDRSRYAIVHGQVRPNWAIETDSTAPAGFISGVSASSLNVPLEWRHVFNGASALRRDGQTPVRYRVDVKFGQRLEPWVDQAARVAPSASP
jgi:hypothetical protein